MKFDEWIKDVSKSLARFEAELPAFRDVEVDVRPRDPRNLESDLYLVNDQDDAEYHRLLTEIYSLFHEIFRAYLAATSEEKQRIRNLFHNKRYLRDFLISYPEDVARSINGIDDAGWLDLGLVAALLEGGVNDYRDLWISLGKLYLKALECGIDPELHFLSVESHEEQDDFFESAFVARSVLGDFLKSDYLRSIRP